MGGCCCGAPRSSELSGSSALFHHNAAAISALSGGLLVNTNLDTSVPDASRPPLGPLPSQAGVLRSSSTAIELTEGSGQKTKLISQSSNTQPIEELTPGCKIKNPDSDELQVNLDLPEEDDDFKKPDASVVFEDEEDVCPTCLEEYDTENPKIPTKCGHHFHLSCILEWMERSYTCPVCDQEMDYGPSAAG